MRETEKRLNAGTETETRNTDVDVRIGDDGVGLPDRSRWDRPQTLGMELIHTLAGQLDATVELADGPGTVYAIATIREERRKRA